MKFPLLKKDTMDELHSRISVSDRILNDLRSVVKQIYYDSVNHELKSENKTYLCMTLIKNLDEALCHGLKQLHLGYWKPMQSVLHSQFLSQLETLPKYNGMECNNLNKGRTWIALALREECLVNYIHCMITETRVNKYYERWSIIRNNDRCNKFLSILSGLDNIHFSFQIDFINRPPSFCDFNVKDIREQDAKIKNKNLSASKTSITASSSSLMSPVDSGVHIQDSSSDVEQLPEDKTTDIDLLNGNVPETVMRRKMKKDTKRHVSFHEDIIYKSPEKCRKLKWDCEKLRYSWSGEEIDSSILVNTDFGEIKSQMESSNTSKIMGLDERGAPEGEEAPCNLENFKQINKTQKSIIVKRFLQSINKQSKIKQLSKKYSNMSHPYTFFTRIEPDKEFLREVNKEIESECKAHSKPNVSKYEVSLNPDMISQMMKHETIYKVYRLRDYLFIIASSNIYLFTKTLEMRKIDLDNVKRIIIYPDFHVFWLWESKDKIHKFVTGEEELTHEIMGRLELTMRRHRFELPQFHILSHGDLAQLKRQLISRCVIDKSENFVYCGFINVEKEMEPLETCTSTTKRGFLMYRDQRAGDSWIPGDFLLKGSFLYLFSDELKNPKFAINLPTTCRLCSRTPDSGRPHTFQITIADEEADHRNEESHKLVKSKYLRTDTRKLFSEIRQKVNKLLTFGSNCNDCCVLEFAAANENDLSEWIQMIIRASCGDCGEEACREDVVEGTLLLTENSLIITKELFSGQDFEILSCAQISDVAGFRVGKDARDLFILVEFSCMEATSTSGDWVIFLSSRDEVKKLGTVLRRLWCFNTKYPGGYLTEERLINKYRKTQAILCKNYWTHLLQ